MSDVITYNSGEIELKVSVENDTIWLTQKQLAELFDVTTPNINMHIKAIFKEKELDKNPTVKKSLIVQKEGSREITRNVEHYNLDIIISVGYRVNSNKATKFRQWATAVLKKYITNGYVINSDKITNDRFVSLEKEVITLRQKVEVISNGLENKTFQSKQQIYFNGSYFDAHSFIVDLINSAEKNIVLIDGYIDNSTLTMLSTNQKVNITLISHIFSKQLKLNIEKYNKQYKRLKTITNKTFHDRYLIIDGTKVYSIGASLKDVGHKTFNISLMNDFCEDDILKRM